MVEKCFLFILFACITFIWATKHTCQAHLLTHPYQELRQNESETGHHITFFFVFSFLFNAIIIVQTNIDRIDP